ncbi:hypothetical protein F442_04187, partial [Phytophthora nicotianae P10297]
NHKNYKFYTAFADAKINKQLDKWLQEGMTTTDVWNKMGFKDTTADDLPRIFESERFKPYLRYANAFDNAMKKAARAHAEIERAIKAGEL